MGTFISDMANIKKGLLSRTVQWWKHLRPEWKRVQWKKEREAEKKFIREERGKW